MNGWVREVFVVILAAGLGVGGTLVVSNIERLNRVEAAVASHDAQLKSLEGWLVRVETLLRERLPQ